MSRRGFGWWGTLPLLVGTAGLLMLAFGARGMADPGEIDARVRQIMGNIVETLNSVADDEEMKESEKRKATAEILTQGERALRALGKAVDLQSLAPKKGQKLTAEWVAQVRGSMEEQLSDRREPAGALAERMSFYAGLVVVFAAGVLLYRRTPESNRSAW